MFCVLMFKYNDVYFFGLQVKTMYSNNRHPCFMTSVKKTDCTVMSGVNNKVNRSYNCVESFTSTAFPEIS